jgi:hypothetical protein
VIWFLRTVIATLRATMLVGQAEKFARRESYEIALHKLERASVVLHARGLHLTNPPTIAVLMTCAKARFEVAEYLGGAEMIRNARTEVGHALTVVSATFGGLPSVDPYITRWLEWARMSVNGDARNSGPREFRDPTRP